MVHRNRWITELKNGDFPWQTVNVIARLLGFFGPGHHGIDALAKEYDLRPIAGWVAENRDATGWIRSASQRRVANGPFPHEVAKPRRPLEAHHPNVKWKPWKTMENHGKPWFNRGWTMMIWHFGTIYRVFNIRGMRIVDMLCSCCQQLSVTCSFSGGPGGRKTASPWRWRNRLSRLGHAEPHFEKTCYNRRCPLVSGKICSTAA